jgi:xanthine dehydrogenase iron-sulfur cluster and FAD-binding subunit A
VTGPDRAAESGPIELDAAEVRERMAGNLCRCGAYANIVPAVLDAAAAIGSPRAALPAAALDDAVVTPR